MKWNYCLEVSDLEACHDHIVTQYANQHGKRWTFKITAFVLPMLIGFSLSLMYRQAYLSPEDVKNWMLLVAGTLFLVALISTQWWMRSGKQKKWLEMLAGNYELMLSPGGAWFMTANQRSFYSWHQIKALEEMDRYWLLYLRRSLAIPIPKSAFSEASSAGFREEISRLWSNHPENKGETLHNKITRLPIGEYFRQMIGANLWAGFRLVCFRKASPDDFKVGVRPLLWLIALEFLISLLHDYIMALPAPVFEMSAISAFVSGIVVFLFCGTIVGAMMIRQDSILRLLVMLQASGLIVLILYYAASLVITKVIEPAQTASTLSWVFFIAWQVWVLLVELRVIHMLYRQPWPSTLLFASLFSLLSYALSFSLVSEQRIFYPEYTSDESAKNEPKIDAEATFYLQPQLMNQAVTRLKEQRPGITDLYFIGFAGQANEKVFTNEVRYVHGLLDRRFDTVDRSMVLLNHKSAVMDTPMANTHNLDIALAGVASRMDREEDILFLFLTSHGAKDHSLSVSFWPMSLNELKAEKLKELLDKHGIRNRVIVVSACYSGGFLDVLKEDNSLVLTASSRDHVSYGCGDATEYTYFGESYFIKSLSNENSFISAFDKARGLISEREKAEGKDASNPQIFVGKNIQRKLDALEVKPPSAILRKG